MQIDKYKINSILKQYGLKQEDLVYAMGINSTTYWRRFQNANWDEQSIDFLNKKLREITGSTVTIEPF